MRYPTHGARTHANLQDLLTRSIRGANNCIEWQQGKDQFGYGQFRVNGKTKSVHRLVATLVYGEPLTGQQALHSCDNPSCINPDHLRWGTTQENTADRDTRNRGNFTGPKKAWTTKLDELQVQQIRLLVASGDSKASVGRIYGISGRHVLSIVRRESWGNVR